VTDAQQPQTEDDLPDPRLLWRWIGDATRPVIGWVLVAVGAVMIIVGYVGVANEVLVAKQLPYLVSGGILGVAVVVVGVMFLGTEQIRRDSGRLDRLERMVEELHAVLLTRDDAPAQLTAATPTGTDRTALALVALPDGDRYHTVDCRVVQGKPDVAAVNLRTIRRRTLEPCPLCDPIVEAG
jgi:hypothetical protein